ncbi:Class I SAM-dependent rRNA methyltransferase [Candidatus Hepatincolaceae symbiont of Richtersius coronifer]
MYKTITLKKDKINSLLTGHPWVFSGALSKIDFTIEEGEIVALYTESPHITSLSTDPLSKGGTFLAYGFYNPKQSIAFKILSLDVKAKINQDFFTNRLKQLEALKKSLINNETNGYRLANADADYLPGLIIDIYDTLAVLQISNIGMQKYIPMIVTALKSLKLHTIIEKLSNKLQIENALSPGGKADIILHYKDLEDKTNYSQHNFTPFAGNESDYFLFKENSLLFLSDPYYGQKTGFFLDQKEARLWLKNHSKEKSIVNLFSYSGGFGVAALVGGASKIINVDSSEQALNLCATNIALNDLNQVFINKYENIKTDVFNYLITDFSADIIVCDPPAFAKNKGALENATNAYIKLNYKCLSKLQSGGILITSSCSGLIKMEDFIAIVRKAALLAKKQLMILAEFKQSADHTSLLGFKEGDYLKTLVLKVL